MPHIEQAKPVIAILDDHSDYHELARGSSKSSQKHFTKQPCTRQILSRDQPILHAALYHIPGKMRSGFLVLATILTQLVFQQERHQLRELHNFFFFIRQSRHDVAGDKVAAIGEFDVSWSRRSLADGGDNRCVLVELADDGVRGGITVARSNIAVGRVLSLLTLFRTRWV